MQNYSYFLSLQIWHPNIDPSFITKRLGMKPEHANMFGTQRQTPKGRLLEGVYRESYWIADPFERGEYFSTDDMLEDAVAEVFDELTPHTQFLLMLREQGARLHLKASSFGKRNYALELSPQWMLRCAGLGLSFVHDVYP
ncbi:DUF4279 domain-containing protein [Undibacterium sp. TC4M20W]|uniref:DUF4279 domain-containing protein n=1 Tax=unclassified Undibacterium TaxID=2630295 RepID=UPI003BF32987